MSLHIAETLLESLAFNGMDARQLKIEQALDSTCQWIYSHPKYRQWKADSGTDARRNFLWIKGKAGSGKSCLMKSLIQHVGEENDNAVCMNFYFDARGSELERLPTGFLRSLLLGIVQKFPNLLVDDFAAQYKKKLDIDHADWTQEELKDMIRQAMQSMQFRPVYIFVDALDECTDISPDEHRQARNLLRFLEDILRVSPQPLRICLSSRHYPHISCRDEAMFTEIFMEQENHPDICEYVRFWLQPNATIKVMSKENQMANDILRRSEGVFLWVVIVVQNIIAAKDRGKSKGYLLKLAFTITAWGAFTKTTEQT